MVGVGYKPELQYDIRGLIQYKPPAVLSFDNNIRMHMTLNFTISSVYEDLIYIYTSIGGGGVKGSYGGDQMN